MATSYNYVPVNKPGASSTLAFGVNDFGQVVGRYEDGTGHHGFLDTDGRFSTIDVPGASLTEAGLFNAVVLASLGPSCHTCGMK